MEKIMCLFIFALCGANALTFDQANRIAGGSVAAVNQFPYAISLQQISEIQTITRGHRCGGALITAQHVLTTASCLYNTVNNVNVLINPAEYRVFAGAVQLTSDAVQDRIRFIANFTVHPDYVATANVNNIAIITLTTPFLNTTASPLPLPSALFEPADFTLCQIAGWGSQNMTATASVDLMYGYKIIYNQPLCGLQYSGILNIFPTMVCAASYDLMSTGCIGDQGNALVCNGGLTGILIQPNNCIISAQPEVYVRVSNYTQWIGSITGGAATFQPGVAVLIMLTVVQLITASIS